MPTSESRFLMSRPCTEGLQYCQVIPNIQCRFYSEAIEETAKFVKPLQDDKELQRDFISELKQPHRNLMKLCNELHALQERLVSQSGERGCETSFPELLGHLSTPSPHTLDQVKALTIAAETFRELPFISVERILKLTPEEQNNLFILFEKIPVSSSVHGLSLPAMPESDPVCEQLLMRIGFTNCRGHLIYEKQRGYCGLDKITLTIIAVHSVTATS